MRHRPAVRGSRGGGGGFPLHLLQMWIQKSSRIPPCPIVLGQGRGSKGLWEWLSFSDTRLFTWFQISSSGAHPSTQDPRPTPSLVTNCCLLQGTSSETFRLQSPFSRFLFPERTFLLRNLHHFFYPLKVSSPLLPGLTPSSRKGFTL